MKVHNFIKNHQLFTDYSEPIMDLIQSGRVRINGKRRRTNRDIVPARDMVEVDMGGNDTAWTLLEPEINRTLMLLYKPVGYLCTHSDVYGRSIIYSLIDEKFRRLRSAGRLDQDSEGLLVLSDDGYYLFALTSPKFPCQKKYLVGVTFELSEAMIEKAASGTFTIFRDGKRLQLRPVIISRMDEENFSTFSYLHFDTTLFWYEFTLEEGKYNQIRKMCLSYHIPVQRLIRIQHGEHILTKELFESGSVVVSIKKNI